LWETLQELKTWTPNEEGLDIVVLHNKKMLVQFKSTYGHAMCNVLKHKQSFIDGTNNLTTPSISNFIPGSTPPFAPTSISMDSDPLLIGPVVSSGPSSTSIPTPTIKRRTIHL